MTSTSCSNYSFQAAIAMNNIGVSLLQRRAFVDALDTLQKSSKLFQSIMEKKISTTNDSCPAMSQCRSKDQNKPSPECTSEKVCANTMLTEAYVKLAKSTNGSLTQLDVPTCTMEVRVISILDRLTIETSLLDAAKSSPNRLILTAIRLEQDTDLGTGTSVEIDPSTRLEPAIVLYNIGTLCRLLAETMKLAASESNISKNGTCKYHKITQKGFKVCEKTRETLVHLMSSDDPNSVLTLQQSSLLLLTLKNLMYLSSDLGKTSDSRAFYCLYCDIRTSIIDDETDETYYLSPTTNILYHPKASAEAA
jgi:hypothetical protein